MKQAMNIFLSKKLGRVHSNCLVHEKEVKGMKSRFQELVEEATKC